VLVVVKRTWSATAHASMLRSLRASTRSCCATPTWESFWMVDSPYPGPVSAHVCATMASTHATGSCGVVVAEGHGSSESVLDSTQHTLRCSHPPQARCGMEWAGAVSVVWVTLGA
jgi:hypothetical protein